jgi:prepilin peptidase CpaA
VLWIPLGLLAIAAAVDLRRREVPDAIPVALLAWAIVARVGGLSTISWTSLAAGAACALALGVCLFAIGAFGGGDVKTLAALGAVLGVRDFFPVLFYIAIAGGVLGALASIRGRRDLAYAPAIMLGFLAFVVSRGLR